MDDDLITLLWILIFAVVVIYLFWLKSSNKKVDEYKNWNNNTRYPKKSNQEDTIYNMDISELFNTYAATKNVPNLDSLINRAYINRHISNKVSRFYDLWDKDQKTVLRIAINIWNKRQLEKDMSKDIEAMDTEEHGEFEELEDSRPF